LGEPNRDEVAAFWARYLQKSGADPTPSEPPAWCFGDTVELADELMELVVGGPKRATAGTVAEYKADGEPLPAPGDLSIATDGSMRPRAVLDARLGLEFHSHIPVVFERFVVRYQEASVGEGGARVDSGRSTLK